MDSKFDIYFINLIKRLKQFKPFNLVIVPGNIGDYLIVKGATKLFDENSLNYKMVNYDEKVETGSTNVILANGNLTFYDQVLRFVQTNSKNSNKFIFTSCTICNHNDFIYKLNKSEDIEFYSRDIITHKIVSALGATSHLSVDLALYLNKEDFSFKKINIPETTFFRVDVENTSNKKISKHNIDLSNNYIFFKYQEFETDKFKHEFEFFINYIWSSNKIITNRLHVSILGIILNKEVELYPNSYYKMESMYETHLKGLLKLIDLN